MKKHTLKNPFKFGSVVDVPYFTNRKDELKKVTSILNSDVHLIMMSPRRYGKTSLIKKAVNKLGRPNIHVDLQIITSEVDLAEHLLKKCYAIFPLEKIKKFIKSFRIIPNISFNPVSEEINITFGTLQQGSTALEDVLNLFNSISSESRRMIVIFDEFQAIRKIGLDAETMMRSIMQHHDCINYVFLGSQESLMRDIFENRKSSFYHFGYIFTLSKISRADFLRFLMDGFKHIDDGYEDISEKILTITNSHPYFTQQLAFEVWETILNRKARKDPVETGFLEIIRYHDIDFERIWNTLKNLDMKVLTGLAVSDLPPTSAQFVRNFRTGSTSSVYSSLVRLAEKGYVTRSESGYEIDDPFFKEWIVKKRKDY